MKKIIIAAYSVPQRIIGNEGSIPWKLKQDMKRFSEVTRNHPLIMGYETGMSILEQRGKPLKDRTTIFVSSKRRLPKIEGMDLIKDRKVLLARNLDEAFYLAHEDALERKVGEIYIAGGQTIYEQTIDNPEVEYLDITEIHGSFRGDRFFPAIDSKVWQEVWKESHLDDEGYCFKKYQRKK